MEIMVISMIDYEFWKNKKVFMTGHTGFKGSWLSLWLHLLGAKVTGYSLTPSTHPSMYELCKLDEIVHSYIADIRNRDELIQAMIDSSPDVVIHMAAQPIVRESYKNPVETYETNVLGTVNVLEAVRTAANQGIKIQGVLNVTSDKCYENNEWEWGYRENDRLGGRDPYSNSKACAELVTDSYRRSFFKQLGIPVATARAGNVIGGGDWASDRIIPDCIRACLNGEKMNIRYPEAVRPWQHVLEPLHGYLLLLEKLSKEGFSWSGAWNFGPNDEDIRTVKWIVTEFYRKWGESASFKIEQQDNQEKEALVLKLDCSKAKQRLHWRPVWDLSKALDKIVEWIRAYESGKEDLRNFSMKQIKEFMKDVKKDGYSAPSSSGSV